MDGQAQPDEEPWARQPDGTWLVSVRVVPQAKRSEITGVQGGALRVRVAAPAHEGRANAELVKLLSGKLGVPRRQVTIVRGERGRDKSVRVPASAPLGELLDD